MVECGTRLSSSIHMSTYRNTSRRERMWRSTETPWLQKLKITR